MDEVSLSSSEPVGHMLHCYIKGAQHDGNVEQVQIIAIGISYAVQFHCIYIGIVENGGLSFQNTTSKSAQLYNS